MSESKNGRYGLFTAASMVIGIVIGSGIFFKADDILGMTGSIGLGVLGFLLVGVGVICGAVIVSQYAVSNPKSGGLVAYSQQAFGPKFGLIAAWLLQSVYFPAFIAILARVTAIYTVMLFGWSESFVLPISLFYLVGCFVTNYMSPDLGGRLQVITTISKLIPLIIIGIVGVLFNFDTETVTTSYVGDTNFFGGLIAIAFAFDGWIVATSISGEIKNMKRNLPLALILGTVMIVIIYIVYFAGISLLIGPDQVIQAGDGHVTLAANKLFGPIGEKVITLFVVISAFGGTNGMTLAYLRMPKVLTENELFNDKLSFAKVDERTGISSKGAVVCALFLVFYVVLDNLSISSITLFTNLGIDISALPMIPVYIIYALLYIGVIKLLRETKASPLYYVALVVAVIVALIVLIGSIPNNGLLYLLMSAFMYVFLLPFLQKK